MISKNPIPNFKKKWDIVGCFIQCNGEFVLLHRSKEEAHKDTWGLPAGKVDPGETIEEAVMREVKEETGLDIPAAWLKHFDSYYVRHESTDLEWHMFSVKFDIKPKIILNPSEHSEFKWVMPDEGVAIENPIHDLKESIELFYNLMPTT